MRPLHLKIRGVNGRFEDGAALDLSGLSGLVAVVGPNGAGKTTLMEALLPASLYRRLPSRSIPLSAACVGPATIDLSLEHAGATWRAVHQVDPTANGGRGRADAILFRGSEPLTGGRLTDFDEVVAREFPTADVVLASVFAAQRGVGSFASLDPAARRDLLARILGLEDVQRLAERARDGRKVLDSHAITVRDGYDRSVAAVAEEETVREEVARLADEVGAADQLLDQAAAEETLQAGALASLRGAAEERRRRAAEQEGKRADLATRRARAVASRTARLGELETAEATIGRLALLEGRVTRYQALTAERAEVRTLFAETRAAHVRTNTALDAAEGAAARNARRIRLLEDLERKIAEAGDPGAIEARLRGEVAEAARLYDAALAAVPARLDPCPVTESALALQEDAIRRAESGAGAIGVVPCGGGPFVRSFPGGETHPRDGGACMFLAGARSAQEQLPALREQLERDRATLTDWAARFAEREARRAEADARAKDLRALESDLDRAIVRARDQAHDRAERDRLPPAEEVPNRANLVLDLRKLAVELTAQEARGVALATEIAAMGDPAAELSAAQRAVGSIEGLRTAIATEADRVADLDRQLADLAAPPEEVDEGPIRAAEAALARARTALREARAVAQDRRSLLGRAEGRHQALAGAADELDRARARLASVDRSRSGWVLLERGLGREGIQALEIDAAGPALGQLTTDFLTEIVGPRWAVNLRTIREAEGARKQREVCELVVADGERAGAERTIDRLSGGEQVVVEEALKLAIAVFNARRTGIRWGALFRDECDGALSPAVADRYPAMLRAAAAAGGFETVYFVTHRPEVAAQADARISVGADGSVSLEVS